MSSSSPSIHNSSPSIHHSSINVHPDSTEAPRAKQIDLSKVEAEFQGRKVTYTSLKLVKQDGAGHVKEYEGTFTTVPEKSSRCSLIGGIFLAAVTHIGFAVAGYYYHSNYVCE